MVELDNVSRKEFAKCEIKKLKSNYSDLNLTQLLKIVTAMYSMLRSEISNSIKKS
jgi:hypothetical protein